MTQTSTPVFSRAELTRLAFAMSEAADNAHFDERLGEAIDAHLLAARLWDATGNSDDVAASHRTQARALQRERIRAMELAL